MNRGARSTVAPASKGGRDAPAEVLGGFREPVERAWCMSAEGSVTMISNRPHRTRAGRRPAAAVVVPFLATACSGTTGTTRPAAHYFCDAHATDDHLATRSHAPRC